MERPDSLFGILIVETKDGMEFKPFWNTTTANGENMMLNNGQKRN
jgi:hypothetical protein